VPPVTWDQVRARRLERSSLIPRAAADGLVEVTRNTAGVHAQVQASAELQLAARVEGITRADVQEALWDRRTLVKAWTVRGTLHLHPAGELALWLAARRAVSPAESGLEEWRDPNGVVHPALGPDEVQAIRQAVWDALDGRCLTREELSTEVVKRVGPRPRERLLSGFAFFLGELCQGPPQGSKVTFARPDQWIEGWREVDPQDALLLVCRRFLHAYGPARPADFREWFSGPAFKTATARELFGRLDLEEIGVEDHRAFVLAGDAVFPEPQATVRLLPEYDVYVMGFRQREHLVPERVRKQVAAHGRGRYEGPAGVRFVMIDGIAAGLWERKKRGKHLALRIEPVRRLTRAQRSGIEDEVERIGAFTGLLTSELDLG
jgi:DNA glycosylase AlkZ-like